MTVQAYANDLCKITTSYVVILVVINYKPSNCMIYFDLHPPRHKTCMLQPFFPGKPPIPSNDTLVMCSLIFNIFKPFNLFF